MPLAKIRDQAMRWSREQKLEHFYSLRSPEQSVLDVGVSSIDWADHINIFLKQFRGDPALYTGLAVDDIGEVARQHPDKYFCRYDGRIFPFVDDAFDWVFSNAVVEHVGNRQSQVLFVKEMCRVSKNVFFTTPNKYFPVESHTNTLFRHWSSPYFYRWCQKHQPQWNEDNLFLMSRAYLEGLLNEAGVSGYRIAANRLLGWPMTFTVVVS